MWLAELALLVISNTCGLKKKTLRTFGYSTASWRFSAWAIKYFQSFPQVTYWQLDLWSSDPIQSFRELKNTNMSQHRQKIEKWQSVGYNHGKGITLGLKGITGDPIISLGAPKSSTFISRWEMESWTDGSLSLTSWCPSRNSDLPVPSSTVQGLLGL